MTAVAPWLPLLGILALLLLSAHGPGIVASASADSVSQTLTIGGLVDAEVHMTPSCAAEALSIGSLAPDGTPKGTSSDCTMAIGSNSPNGVDLMISDESAAAEPGRDAMVCIDPSCSDPTPATFPDGQGSSLPGSSSQSAFGMRLSSTGAAASGVWTANAQSVPSGAYYDVQDTPDAACRTSSSSDGTCAFRFAARASSTQLPGAYRAQVYFEVFAR